MRANCCSWKCFATGLLISTLLFITIAMIGGLVAIPVIYVHCPKDHHQVSASVYHMHSMHTLYNEHCACAFTVRDVLEIQSFQTQK